MPAAPALRGRSLRALVALVLSCRGLLAQAADTEVPEPPAAFLSIGPAVQVVPEYPGARDSRTSLLPDIEAQYHNWLYISATDLLGAYAYNHGGDKLGAAILYDFTERSERDSSG